MSFFVPKKPEIKTRDCPECEGRGYIPCPYCEATGCEFPSSKVGYCDHCEGTGKFKCFDCGGLGWFRID